MPDHDFRTVRLFVEADLAGDAVLETTPGQANYLVNVMRLGDDAPVLVFNGRDGEWRAALKRLSRKTVVLTVCEQVREQTPPPGLHYLFAPLKQARLDYMVQKATEMGAGVLQPVLTQHVQAPRINIERCRANAVEAAEQCGILSLPDCREPLRLHDLLKRFDPERRLVFCDERAGAVNPVELLRQHGGRPVSLLVGPEGGFAGAERDLLMSFDFVTAISLGPRILRADTAAVAALAVVQAAVGDWGSP